MLRDIRAELTKQSRRPASWLLLAVAVVLTLTFGYVVPYAALGGTPVSGGPGAGRGLSAMLPDAFVGSALGGLPIFVGALALIFGVLVAGSEYGYGTWKTVLVQHPSRLAVYAAKLVTVAVAALAVVLALFAAAAGAGAVVASLQDQPQSWPPASDVVLGLGAGWLVTTMWGVLGVLLAIGLRSVALPIGLGLVWLLAVQNLLASVAAPLLDWVAQLQKALPGPNAGALAAAFGADAPGADGIVGSGQAAVVLAAYLVAFGLLGGRLLHRRDIA
ncbi:ABC transporter permease [Amycolatopsis australiensis]|uniref:ABC-type transport system involved in multi-copper enzyme maturation, permease component n=1 Tax=Amycolatopsis australiensis TaxID=546364 RepID=A0A1K1RDE2_9PSEU|nr:ABC transporter permease [Amycolatopsis australiensis]SFW69961.1 ABC-type transport system involved in multi-copper enzyme maturation, permease component [Amycolatopsis australiensis]